MGEFFNAPVVTPELPANRINVAFATGDIVFDWQAFDIPKGSAKVIGATITYRHNKVASQVAGLDLVFARDDGTNTTPTSLGAVNSVLGVTNFADSFKDSVGILSMANGDLVIGTAATTAGIQTTGGGNTQSAIVLEPSSGGGGANVGYDRYYVAGLAAGALDIQSLVALDDDVDISGNNGTINTLDGTACNTVFAVGDIIHAQDLIVLGEIASLDANSITFKFDGSTSTNHAVVAGNATYTVPADIAAWRIQNGAGAAGDLSNNDLLYNVHPIRVTIHLEK